MAETRTQVNGLIQSREFADGSTVKAGDLLYQIEPAPYKAAYDQAKAALATEEAERTPTCPRSAQGRSD